ncbi:BCL2 associated agonist of cell death b [Xyrauchen texanus]|uniref:BCL2 associated agonist of cell death b n=1 Tax=Xyrauchen texanus TaxID=154827 RepID=UPI00224215AE|nr:BCL2 associated agonist of cell death b [Xyrauchen texanus]
MAQMFTLSDNESDTSEGREDSGHRQTEAKSGSPLRRQHLTAQDKLKGEQFGRQRNLSMNEEDLLVAGAGEEDSVGGDPFRPRSRSAPPVLWAAKKYGQQLRRMSDEFDILLDKGMKRAKSAGTARQMRQSPSWLALLWSHKESDAESRPAE